MRACVKNSHIRWMLRWREVVRAQSNGCEWSSGFAGLRSYDPSRSLSCRRQHPHLHYCYTEYINLSAAHPLFSLSSTHTHAQHGHKTNRGKTHTHARGRPWVRGEKKKILRVTQILTHAFSYEFVNSYLYPRRRRPFPEPVWQ